MKPFKGMTSENTALLIIDVINSCAHEECEIPEWGIHFSKIRKMVPKLNTFIDQYRKQVGGTIIFGKTNPWRKECLAHNVNGLYEQEQFSYYSKDITGFAEQFYGISLYDGDLVFDKDTNDALANQKLENEIIKRGIKYIITTGIFTDGCVLATVVGGFSKGYNFIVLRDLVETTDGKTRQEIQKYLLDYTFPYLFARVITSEELLKSLA